MPEDKQRPHEDAIGERPEHEPVRAEPSESEASAGVSHGDASVATVGAETATEASQGQAPPAAPASEVRPSAAPRQRTPWLALLASGLLGGAVVALAGLYYWIAAASDDGAMNVLWARLGAVELAVQDLGARRPESPAADAPGLAALAERVAKIEAAMQGAAGPAGPGAGAPSADPALIDRLSAIETGAKSLADAVAALQRRADETTSALQELRERAVAEPPAVGKAEFDALAARIAALQQEIASLQQAAERRAERATGDRAARLVLVASALRNAVASGASYAGELAAAKALGADPQALTELEPFAATGAPSAEALSRELAALAPELAPRRDAAAGQGYLARLLAHAERLVRVRPVDAAAGDDHAGAVARIEAKARQADIEGALAELRKLPEAARAPAAAWIKKAEARVAAIAAARRLEAAALAALANP